MMQAAVNLCVSRCAKLGRPAPKLIAVTILTSMDDEQFGDLNYKNTIAEQVIALAKLAQESWHGWCRCLATGSCRYSKCLWSRVLIVTRCTPGASIDDQSRIAILSEDI